MSYMALYRKFRPQTFAQVRGQDHVVRTLKNQIINNRIGHAYLFSGTRGTGKTSVAKLFARAINCTDPADGEPCGRCENCQAIARDAFMDVVEIDAASNTGVDDIRRIIEEVRYSPAKGRYKVYIIDEAHMLSGSAFNAFLKTLEEPPAYAVFILATTEPHALPITILSRCQRYDFHRIETSTIADNLNTLLASEGVEAEDTAVRYIARMGDGSMRDAISLLDKCIAFSLGEKMTYDMVLQTLGTVDTVVFSRTFHAVWNGDSASALKELENAADSGGDISRFVNDFIWYLRNLLLIKAAPSTDEQVLGITSENMELLRADAAGADEEVLMRYIRIMSELANNLRTSSSRQIQAEVAFIKLARPQMETDTASLADRIRHIEAAIGNAPAVQSDAAPRQFREEPVIHEPVQAQAPMEPAHPQPQEMLQSVQNDAALPTEDIMPEIKFEQFDTNSMAEQTPAAPRQNVPEQTVSGAGTPAQLVCSRWQDIIGGLDSPRIRFSLKKAQIREIEADRVQIFGIDGINYQSIKENVASIEKAIAAFTGQHVSVDVKEGNAPAPQRVSQTASAQAPAQQKAAPPAPAPEQPVHNETNNSREGLEALLGSIKFDVRMEDE